MVLINDEAARPGDEALKLESHNIIFASLEKIWNWGRSWSFWPLSYGCNCCPIEMMAAGTARFDIARYGYEVFRASPRQADLLIVAGPITVKMAPVVKRLYEQMPAPKWVLAMGNCAISGGPFRDGYSILPGVDSMLPVDIYVPGCPVRPEALFHGLLELKDKVSPPLQIGRKRRTSAFPPVQPEKTAPETSLPNDKPDPAANAPAIPRRPIPLRQRWPTLLQYRRQVPLRYQLPMPLRQRQKKGGAGMTDLLATLSIEGLRALLPESADIQSEWQFLTIPLPARSCNGGPGDSERAGVLQLPGQSHGGGLPGWPGDGLSPVLPARP